MSSTIRSEALRNVEVAKVEEYPDVIFYRSGVSNAYAYYLPEDHVKIATKAIHEILKELTELCSQLGYKFHIASINYFADLGGAHYKIDVVIWKTDCDDRALMNPYDAADIRNYEDYHYASEENPEFDGVDIDVYGFKAGDVLKTLRLEIWVGPMTSEKTIQEAKKMLRNILTKYILDAPYPYTK